ncbi:hypothetical protein PsorP6_014408 [Peronosclerospora sorghi]|uniref:Uncharacterized protein n=1 Tax=Peronosclerospora sorghi TaxID=230839 RepID=A0ACC0VG99_9STRA|nr:hypothetical protein PsorP6_014408 [Peronosclerospora sorghi]
MKLKKMQQKRFSRKYTSTCTPLLETSRTTKCALSSSFPAMSASHVERVPGLPSNGQHCVNDHTAPSITLCLHLS